VNAWAARKPEPTINSNQVKSDESEQKRPEKSAPVASTPSPPAKNVSSPPQKNAWGVKTEITPRKDLE